MSQDLAPLLIGMKRPRRCNVPDAYYWPLTVVICLLVGSVAGLVLATKELVHPRAVWQGGWSVLVQSGWLHLAADVGLLVVLLVSGLLLRGAVLRRVQMCVLLSILGHLWLAVYLYAQRCRSTCLWTRKSSALNCRRSWRRCPITTGTGLTSRWMPRRVNRSSSRCRCPCPNRPKRRRSSVRTWIRRLLRPSPSPSRVPTRHRMPST